MTLQRADRPNPWKHPLRRAGLAFGILVFLGFLSIFLMNWWVVRSATGQIYTKVESVPEEPVALVLGAGPGSYFFAARLDAAAALYHAGKVKHFLVSGDGEAMDPQGSETALMRRGLD